MATESYQERRKRVEDEAKAKEAAAAKAFWPKLQAALEAAGHTVEMRETSILGSPLGRQVIDKVDGLRFNGAIQPERKRLFVGGADHNGKVKFVLGSSDSKQFFQSKTRGDDFDYAAIVQEVESRITKARAYRAKREAEDQALLEALQMRERLVKEFFPAPAVTKHLVDPDGPGDDTEEFLNVPKGSPVRLKESTQGGLQFIIEAPIKDEAKLRELLAACKKIGFCG
jgi:hypothetical protein